MPENMYLPNGIIVRIINQEQALETLNKTLADQIQRNKTQLNGLTNLKKLCRIVLFAPSGSF